MAMEAKRRQVEEDAALARSLAEEPEAAAAPARASSGSTAQAFSLRAGQRAAIRLHHPASRNHIGESFYANYTTASEVAFELVNETGKFLRVLPDGSVEFSKVQDSTSRFVFEVTPEGYIYLGAVAHREKLTESGATGWFLALMRDGGLAGNASKSPISQWVLVAAGDAPSSLPASMPTPPPASNSSVMPYGRLPTAAAPPAAAPVPPAPAAAQTEGSRSLGGFFNWGGERGGENYEAIPMTDGSNSHSQLNPLLSPSTTTAIAGPAASQWMYQQPPIPAPAPTPAHPRMPQVPTSSKPHVNPLTLSPDDQLNWLSSGAGQSFLTSLPSEAASQLLSQGRLRPLLYRPDWPWLANTVMTEAAAGQQGTPRFDKTLAEIGCPEPLQRRFFEDGFVVLKGILPLDLVSQANRLASHWSQPTTSAEGGARGRLVSHGLSSGTGCRVELQGGICKDVQCLNVFHRTALFHVAELLIGASEVAPVTTSSIQIYYPSLEPPGETSKLAGSVPGGEWMIEGFTEHGGHSPFSLLVAVPLTSMSKPGSGNLAPHASSHIFLQDSFKSQLASRSTAFSEAVSCPSKPVLPVADPICMTTGDALMMTHKCALSYTANHGEEAAKVIFFRVSHIDHEVGMKEMSLDFVWTEFKGAEVLERPAPTSTATATAGGGGILLDFSSAH